MSLLQVFFIVSGAVILVLALDVSKRQKFNALHFLVFIGIGMGLFVFTVFPAFLDAVGRVFGVPRWADVLVYSSIVFLLYFVLLLLNKVERVDGDLTALIRELAIHEAGESPVQGKVAFVIAAYNESAVIEKTVENVLDSGYWPCVVVNDGSKDSTFKILLRLKRRHPGKVFALSHFKNRGQGAALETGFEYLRRYGETEYVATFDADGQHDISELPKFLDALENRPNTEIALGSRFLGKEAVGIPFSRRIVLKLGILFTWFVSGIGLTDTHNGYRVFRPSVLQKIRITLDGMGHASEILDLIATKKIPHCEVPVTIHYDDYTLGKGQRSSNAISIAAKMIWSKFFR